MSNCPGSDGLSNVEFLRRFNAKTEEQRIPINGGIDLTHRCNLRCLHCYTGPGESGSGEMETAKVLSVLDEITDAGCLFLLLTGGEPLLRRDFSDIYRHARRNGLVVTVFTNATLLTEEIAGAFTELPPQFVEVTFYGATPTTHERITRVAGSFGKTMAGVRRLLDRGISVALKTILMTLNKHEFHAMEALASDLGVRFRFDPALFPKLDGDKGPLAYRVSPEEAIELEFSSANRAEKWREFREHFGCHSHARSLYACGAGMTSFHVDPAGYLMPCLMMRRLRYDLKDGPFLDGWREMMPRIRDAELAADHECRECGRRALCSFCPAFFHAENDCEHVPSSYLCCLGQQREVALDRLTRDKEVTHEV